MKIRNLVLTGVVAAVLTGCTVPAAYYGVTGSKADGTVTIGYDDSDMVILEHNLAAAQRVAAAKCQQWGYADAEAFGGRREVRTGEYTKQGLIEFQCK